MRQRKQKQDRTSLSSKLREFWILHPNIIVILICTIALVIAIVTLCIVGMCRGWSLHTFFTSPNAVLVYVLAGLVLIVYIFQRIIFKRW